MLLTEAEGKQLLRLAGLHVPSGIVIERAAYESAEHLDSLAKQFAGSANQVKADQPEGYSHSGGYFLKAQVLHGNRQLQQLVLRAADFDQITPLLGQLFGQTNQYDQSIDAVLVEHAVEHKPTQERYISIGYDTRERGLVVRYSEAGGAGMDDRASSMQTVALSSVHEPSVFSACSELLPVVQKLWQLVHDHDALLVEVNPLVRMGVGASAGASTFVCLDAKIELEDTAGFRHQEWQQYPKRSPLGRAPTQLELRAHEVSASDHRGVAGESFFDFLGGEVGVLASGGGASLLAMDELLAAGVQPANYTEYSGNPPREKVAALTKVVLSINNLRGLYVVGSNANFTDIYETLAGVVDGLCASSYVQQEGFVVLVRRGGPRWQEAFAMVRERLAEYPVVVRLLGPDFPLVATAQEMKDLLCHS